MIRRLLALALVPLWVPVLFGLVCYVAWADAKDRAREEQEGAG
jgi:hypothetical protein